MFSFFRTGDSAAPQTLESRTIEAVADYIKSGQVKQITVLTGAGLSTAAGIPDFRSPGTGLYSNLARLNLPYAEAVFDISYFRRKPEPFYYLAKELYPGKFYPTISHTFIALLAKKGLLQMNFTQNIDCLERRAGVPADKIVEAHGSFATQRCIECSVAFPDEQMRLHVEAEIVPHCPACGGLVKPDIVFFGEPLPETFRNNIHLPARSDLLIVIGTSLTVYPFAALPEAASPGAPRLLLNKERVGQFGMRSDDVVELGSCDSGVRKLATLLGWREELEELWRSIVGEKEAARQLSRAEEPEDEEEELEEEIRKMTQEVDTALRLEEGDDYGEGEANTASSSRASAAESFVARMARILGGQQTPSERATAATSDNQQVTKADDGKEALSGPQKSAEAGEGANSHTSTGEAAIVESTKEPATAKSNESDKAGPIITPSPPSLEEHGSRVVKPGAVDIEEVRIECKLPPLESPTAEESKQPESAASGQEGGGHILKDPKETDSGAQ